MAATPGPAIPAAPECAPWCKSRRGHKSGKWVVTDGSIDRNCERSYGGVAGYEVVLSRFDSVESAAGGALTVSTEGPNIQIEGRWSDKVLTIQQARALAHKMLAAADEAEARQ